MAGEIDLIEYGKLTAQVENLAKAQEEQNALVSQQIAATASLSTSIDRLSARLGELERSPLLRPAKFWKAGAVALVLILVFAVKGLREGIDTLVSILKALP